MAVACVLGVGLLITFIGPPFPDRRSAREVKLWLHGDFHAQVAELNGKQADELFFLLHSSSRLWFPVKMVSLGEVEIKLTDGKTQRVSLLTVPSKWDAFQVGGRQYGIEPAGQLEKLIA
jgi:hypothetical protein